MKLLSENQIVEVPDEDLSDFIVETFKRTTKSSIYMFQYLIRKTALKRAEESKANNKKYIFKPNEDFFKVEVKIPNIEV